MSYDIAELRRALGKKAAFTWAENPDRVQVKKEEEDDTAPDFELDDDGEPYRGVGVDGLLASSEKLLAINRGMADPDERDHMKFQKVISPDNMLRESIKMDAGKTLRTLMYRVAKHKNLNALAPATFDTYVQRLIIGNPLTSSLEEINPMHLMEAARRITKMGPGGLGSSQAITEATQSVNPSQFGFISPIEGPECIVSDNGAIDVITEHGYVHLEDLTQGTKIMTGDNGMFELPEKVIHHDFAGEVYGMHVKGAGDILLTPNHRIYHYAQEDSSRKEQKVGTAAELYGTSVVIPAAGGNPDLVVDANDWYKTTYTGKVHCVTTPCKKFVIRVNGGTDDKGVLIVTGNSEKAGIDTRVARGVKLGSDGRLYQMFREKRTGKLKWMSPADLDGMTIGIPD